MKKYIFLTISVLLLVMAIIIAGNDNINESLVSIKDSLKDSGKYECITETINYRIDNIKYYYYEIYNFEYDDNTIKNGYIVASNKFNNLDELNYYISNRKVANVLYYKEEIDKDNYIVKDYSKTIVPNYTINNTSLIFNKDYLDMLNKNMTCKEVE